MKGGKNKKTLFYANSFLLFISCLLSLTVAELFIRWNHRSADNFTTNVSMSYLTKNNIKTSGIVTDDYYNMFSVPWHTPGKTWEWAGQKGRKIEFFIKDKWNNKGCHDDLDYHFVPDKTRVLIMGDSFVEAMQVSTSMSFYGLLNQSSISNSYIFYGCGVSGWSPSYAYNNLSGKNLDYIQNLDDLEPDVVMYMIYIGNDLRNESPEAFDSDVGEKEVSGCEGRVPESESFLRLIELLRKAWYINVYSRSTVPVQCIDDFYWPYIKEKPLAVRRGWSSIFKSIKSIKELTVKKGQRFIIGLIEPYPVAYGDNKFRDVVKYNYRLANTSAFDLSLPSSILKEYLDSINVEFINFSDTFRRDDHQKHYYINDGHLSPIGHNSIKSAILELLLDGDNMGSENTKM